MSAKCVLGSSPWHTPATSSPQGLQSIPFLHLLSPPIHTQHPKGGLFITLKHSNVVLSQFNKYVWFVNTTVEAPCPISSRFSWAFLSSLFSPASATQLHPIFSFTLLSLSFHLHLLVVGVMVQERFLTDSLHHMQHLFLPTDAFLSGAIHTSLKIFSKESDETDIRSKAVMCY